MDGDRQEIDGLAEALARKLRGLLTAPAPRFLDLARAAPYSSMSQDTIRRLIDRGDLTAYRPVRGKILVDREELDRLILGSTDRPRNGRGTAPRQRGGNGQYLAADTEG